jgi:thiol-disulfide isomerase/thioredoxin
MRALAKLTLIAVAAWLGLGRQSCAAEPAAEAPSFAGTAEERELVELIAALYKSYDAYHTQANAIADEEERDKFYGDSDPAREFVPKLLEFEVQHPGTDIGLMALRRVVLLAGGDGNAESASSAGRREALKRLPRYSDRPILVEILRYLDSGASEPASATTLRALADDQDANVTVREFSRLYLATSAVHELRSYGIMTRRLAKLEAGAKPRVAGEEQYYRDALADFASLARLQSDADAAVVELQKIAASKSELRQPAVRGLDPNWYLIELDDQRTQTMPKLTELAEGEIFQQAHLQVGKPAPELEVELLSGDGWSLASQRGKAVVIQFSFKGCGPCEEMYPDLRELQEMHAERLSIVSIMADEHKVDAEEGVTSGKLTWNVHWDGRRGPVATWWAVTAFPTVYIIDTEGRIAEMGLRGDELRAEIARL